MNCIRTPNNLEVLLHCHTSPMVHPRIDAPAVKEAIEFLKAEGLIGQSDRHYETTNKGKFYIQHLLCQPLPVVSFVIPEVKP